jgi:hypothetical protein
MDLREAFNFHVENKVPYCFTLFQPYSSKFYEFYAEAREKELWHSDDEEIFQTTELGKFGIYKKNLFLLTYQFFVKQIQSIKARK